MKGSRWLAPILALALAFSVVGAVSAESCGVSEWHGETDMTKGRTDAIVYHVDHTEGCARVILSNVSPAGHGEAQGNAGQVARAERYAREDAVRTFRFQFGLDVDPSDIEVTITDWTGED